MSFVIDLGPHLRTCAAEADTLPTSGEALVFACRPCLHLTPEILSALTPILGFRYKQVDLISVDLFEPKNGNATRSYSTI